MKTTFCGSDWVSQLQDNLNNSTDFYEASKRWAGDVSIVVTNEKGDVLNTIYLDLWYGACKSAFVSNNLEKTDITFSGSINTWKKLMENPTKPLYYILKEPVFFDGPLEYFMQSPYSVAELLKCAKKIDTDWEFS